MSAFVSDGGNGYLADVRRCAGTPTFQPFAVSFDCTHYEGGDRTTLTVYPGDEYRFVRELLRIVATLRNMTEGEDRECIDETLTEWGITPALTDPDPED